MAENENTWDKRLHIKTSGRDDTNADEYCYPYEPTPYGVLERLVNRGFFSEGDVLLDYGCGKGRVGFFLAYRTKASVIGIEYNERIYKQALKNQQSAASKARTEFVLARAEEYEVPQAVNRCYFFNPFSVEILHKVLANVIASYYERPREVLLFFFYPSDAYISYLMTTDELEFYGQIDCEGLIEGEPRRERVAIFRLPCLEK
ncbi:MAG: methyltransferase domain-containing protein [Ruminococcaceae bacterium]|nr:methyltransferase domain-containing protein [Oscillospiraceae bacterium]